MGLVGHRRTIVGLVGGSGDIGGVSSRQNLEIVWSPSDYDFTTTGDSIFWHFHYRNLTTICKMVQLFRIPLRASIPLSTFCSQHPAGIRIAALQLLRRDQGPPSQVPSHNFACQRTSSCHMYVRSPRYLLVFFFLVVLGFPHHHLVPNSLRPRHDR